MTGAAIMVIEILGAKMLSPYVGLSHFVWTAQIAVTLMALACGYYAGGRLADRSQKLSALYWAILAAAGYLALTVLICEPVAYWCLDFRLAVGSLLASAILFFVPLALLAMTGPFLVRVITSSLAGVGGNVKYLSPIASYRQFFPMKGLKVNREGHNVLGYRLQLAHTTGFGGEVAPPTHRLYGGGEQDLRGFDTRSVSPYTFIPNNVQFTLTNPDGTPVPLNPANPALGNVVIPLPIYRMVSIGGDTQLVTNLEYRIPIINQVTFAFFTDFGMDFDAQPGQLRQSTAGNSLISGVQYGCPTIVNGACFGGTSVKFPLILPIVPGTNYVPRMSNGAELQVILPIVNAPFRIFYAYNSLRLYEDIPQKLAVPNSGPDNVNTFKGYFPTSGAGQFSYQQALQLYGADYILREPRKTFRLTVSTTF